MKKSNIIILGIITIIGASGVLYFFNKKNRKTNDIQSNEKTLDDSKVKAKPDNEEANNFTKAVFLSQKITEITKKNNKKST